MSTITAHRLLAPFRDKQDSITATLGLTATSIILAFLLGALIMVATGIAPAAVGLAYLSMLDGAFGSLYAVSETLTAATPLILAGLGIAIAFRCGLFNIGAEGQLLMGGIAAVFVGFALTGLPLFIHLPVALLAGAVAGGLWAGIAGMLKARTGAHEVITTIMLNFIALRLVDFLLTNPPIQKPGRNDPISQEALPSATLPAILDWVEPHYRLNAGIFLAFLMVALVYWLLFHTKLGFEFRTVGANPQAAKTAGIEIGRTMFLSMAVAGGLAGLAGANQVLGVLGRASPGFSAGIGFDAIAVALLGRGHPVGVLLAGLLFGALEAGGRHMHGQAGIALDIVTILQALVLVFVAAPALTRAITGKLIPHRAARPETPS
ncbi:MAG: ABC transporter permease [Pseudomonadota bacterium]